MSVPASNRRTRKSRSTDHSTYGGGRGDEGDNNKKRRTRGNGKGISGTETDVDKENNETWENEIDLDNGPAINDEKSILASILNKINRFASDLDSLKRTQRIILRKQERFKVLHQADNLKSPKVSRQRQSAKKKVYFCCVACMMTFFFL
jgi:hypothetical protein